MRFESSGSGGRSVAAASRLETVSVTTSVEVTDTRIVELAVTVS